MRGFVIFVIFAGFLGADNVVIFNDSREYSPSLAEGARGWVDSSLQDSWQCANRNPTPSLRGQ